MSIWVDMVKGDNGVGSANNAGFLLCVLVLSVSTVYASIYGSETAFLGIAAILAGQTGLTKTWSKVSDNSVKKAAMAPDPPAPVIVPSPPVINIGGDKPTGNQV